MDAVELELEFFSDDCCAFADHPGGKIVCECADGRALADDGVDVVEEENE